MLDGWFQVYVDGELRAQESDAEGALQYARSMRERCSRSTTIKVVGPENMVLMAIGFRGGGDGG